MLPAEELIDRGQLRRENRQQRLFDHGQTHFGRDRLALRVGRGDGNLHFIAGMQRTFLLVGPGLGDAHAQVALHAKPTLRDVKTAHNDLGLFLCRGLLVANVRHHGHRQLEVRRQLGGHRDGQLVGALLQRDEFVLEHPGALIGHQRQGRLLSPVKLHGGRVADLEGVLVGQNPQPHVVAVVRNTDDVLTGDRVFEAVTALGAENVASAFFQPQGDAAPARFFVGGDFMVFDQPLANLAGHAGPLQHLERELFADRLAFGAGARHRDIERLAADIDRPRGSHENRITLRRKEKVHAGGQVPLR